MAEVRTVETNRWQNPLKSDVAEPICTGLLVHPDATSEDATLTAEAKLSHTQTQFVQPSC